MGPCDIRPDYFCFDAVPAGVHSCRGEFEPVDIPGKSVGSRLIDDESHDMATGSESHALMGDVDEFIAMVRIGNAHRPRDVDPVHFKVKRSTQADRRDPRGQIVVAGCADMQRVIEPFTRLRRGEHPSSAVLSRPRQIDGAGPEVSAAAFKTKGE